jgi:hypothetical protein
MKTDCPRKYLNLWRSVIKGRRLGAEKEKRNFTKLYFIRESDKMFRLK